MITCESSVLFISTFFEAEGRKPPVNVMVHGNNWACWDITEEMNQLLYQWIKPTDLSPRFAVFFSSF